jgi:hypothetical protein
LKLGVNIDVNEYNLLRVWKKLSPNLYQNQIKILNDELLESERRFNRLVQKQISQRQPAADYPPRQMQIPRSTGKSDFSFRNNLNFSEQRQRPRRGVKGFKEVHGKFKERLVDTL